MTRELKFRSWNGKEMREITTLPLPTVSCDTRGDAFMQFTGLKDKNGKEIYEGDIVKFWRGIGKIEFGTGGEGEPADYVGSYEGWCLNPLSHSEEWETNGFLGGEEYEVIGNIYENPELLK